MHTAQIDLDKLYRQADELRDLIHVTNEALDEPVSQLTEDFEFGISRIAPKLAVDFQKMVGRGRLDYVVVGGVVLGAGWVGAKVIDTVRNAASQEKTKAKLASYYQELASKQNKIIAMQPEVNRELSQAVDSLQAEEAEQKQKLDALTKKHAQLSSIISRFAALEKAVTK